MALNSLGILEAVNGDTDAARVAYERSIEIREALVKGNPTVTGFREGLANTLTRLGNHGYASGNTDAARAAYRRSIELYEALVQADPTATEYQIGLAQSRDSLGRLEESNAKVTKMLEELRTKAFEEFDKANPKVTEFREGPGISLNSKSWLLVAVPGREPGEYARAVALAEEALKPDPEDGGVLNTLGVAQYRAGQLAAASASLAKSAEMNRKIAKGIENPADLAFLAMAQWKLGQQPDAETTYARLTETMKRPEFAKDREARQFFREATNLIRPLPLPEDVFQH